MIYSITPEVFVDLFKPDSRLISKRGKLSYIYLGMSVSDELFTGRSILFHQSIKTPRFITADDITTSYGVRYITNIAELKSHTGPIEFSVNDSLYSLTTDGVAKLGEVIDYNSHPSLSSEFLLAAQSTKKEEVQTKTVNPSPINLGDHIAKAWSMISVRSQLKKHVHLFVPECCTEMVQSQIGVPSQSSLVLDYLWVAVLQSTVGELRKPSRFDPGCGSAIYDRFAITVGQSRPPFLNTIAVKIPYELYEAHATASGIKAMPRQLYETWSKDLTVATDLTTLKERFK
jgi:hypothetical protein